MGASLKDVAALAGVSVKTVSNVVNEATNVAPGTRERVRRALDELGYRPNLAARNLRKGRSGIIALALPEMDAPYFAELARFIIRAAEERSWTVLIDQTDGLAERERLVAAGLRPHLIDGVVFSPLALGPEDLAARDKGTPMVLLGERIEQGPADRVGIDNVAAAATATEHLIERGRRRIAAIGDQREQQQRTAHLRRRGYVEALERAGLPVDDTLVRSAASYHRADGARAMAELLALDDPPDAVFCFNDLLALGAVRTLHEHGCRVPEDIAVVGFDDIEDGRFSTPTLTTISPDKEGIARSAIDLLHRHLTGGAGTTPRQVEANYTLLARESTLGRSGL